jgi:hypothetical protein
MEAAKICDMFAYLNSEKSNLANEFQAVVDYFLPDRGNVTRWETPGQRRGITRYDDTAVDALEILAGNFAATLTPMGSVWFELGLQNTRLGDKPKIANWRQECRDLMLAEMAKSNFYLMMDEMYLDLCGFATTAGYAEMVNSQLHYSCWPVKDYVFTMGVDGRVDMVLRQFEMTPINMARRFTQHPGFKQLGAKVTQALDENARAEEKLKSVKVIHAIYPRDSYFRSGNDKLARDMPIASCYVNEEDKVIIAEGGYEEMPVNVARFRVAADDDNGWGRGPAFKTMASVRSMNAAVKMGFKAMAKELDPPLVVEDRGVIGNIRTVPNGITYVRRDSRFEYLESGARPDKAQFWVTRLENRIREAFYADHLRLPPPQGTPMTATEIQIRWELMERLLGPTLGRLQVELLNPLVERTFGLMMRTGKLPQPPRELAEEEMNIVYTGPLAKAQQMPDVIAIERTYQTAATIAQLSGDPTGLKRLNADKSTQRVASLYGFPAEAMRDDDEMEAIMQQQAEQQQGMQDRQDAMMAADMAAKVPAAAA